MTAKTCFQGKASIMKRSLFFLPSFLPFLALTGCFEYSPSLLEGWPGPQDGAVDAIDTLPACESDGDCSDGDPCNGIEICDGETGLCRSSAPPADGFLCDHEPRSVCMAGTCRLSICGDAFLDTGGGEFCDPPGVDGCRDGCLQGCASDGDCIDDGNPCNGLEYCSLTGFLCDRRDPPADGTACASDPARICIGNTCQESSCGDGFHDLAGGEECDDGNGEAGDGCEITCRYSCHGDDECEDGPGCRLGVCDTGMTHRCESAAAPAGTLCRPSASACDARELCDGLSLDCPADVLLPEGAAGEDGNPCTGPELCDRAGACSGVPLVTPGADTILAGGRQTCALLSSGSVACWGDNALGQLGNASTDSSPSPVFVSGIGEETAEVAAGASHGCAATLSGRVLCWGDNEHGQLGNGAWGPGTESPWPLAVPGLPGDTAALAAGDGHSCAIGAGGSLLCWGRNDFGQAGLGTSDSPVSAPAAVTGLGSGVIQASAGGLHTCAVTSDGLAFCWGRNDFGQLGDGSTTDRSAPAAVSLGSGVSVASVAAGSHHSCAVTSGGGALCWGRNDFGQLGDGSTGERRTPVSVSGLDAGVLRLSCGELHTCALMDSGIVKCWGANAFGQLGNGSTSRSKWPVDVSSLESPAEALDCGTNHTCAVLASSGAMLCWGSNAFGQLGNGLSGSGLFSTEPETVSCE